MIIDIPLKNGDTLTINLADGLNRQQIQAEVDEAEKDYYAKLEQPVPQPVGSFEQQAEALRTSPEQADFQKLYEREKKISNDSEQQQKDIDAARIAAQREAKPLFANMAESLPYSSREAYLTGKEPSGVSALKDISSYPVRQVGGLWDFVNGNESEMGKTSEEFAQEGRLARSMLTSPLVLPNLAAAVGTGGMSIPAQVAIQGGTGVLTGMAFNDNYGGSDLALDVGLSALPAAGSIGKGALSAISKSRIAKQLANSPEIMKALEGANTASRSGLEDFAEVYAGDNPALKQSILESNAPMTINENIDDLATIIEKEGYAGGSKELGNRINKSLADVYNKIDINQIPDEILPEADLATLYENIRGTFPKSRNIDQVKESARKLNAFKEDQSLLATLKPKGNVTAEENTVYSRELIRILSKYKDQPELYKQLVTKITEVPRTAAQNLIFSTAQSGGSLPVGDALQMYKSITPNQRAVELAGVPAILEGLEPSSGAMIYSKPIESLADIAKKQFQKPRLAVAPKAARVAGMSGVGASAVRKSEPKTDYDPNQDPNSPLYATKRWGSLDEVYADWLKSKNKQ